MSIKVELVRPETHNLLDYSRLCHLFIATSDEIGFQVQEITKLEDDITVSGGGRIVRQSDLQGINKMEIPIGAAKLFEHLEHMLQEGRYSLQ